MQCKEKEFIVPSGYGEAEYVIKKSRFIGRLWRVDSEEEALLHIKETRERHRDASHNVYAYVLRENAFSRYSDDGEPQGTSGLPVLNVFVKAGIFNLCCVVTRYFGGTLLGAGGLTRAYSHTASLALESAGRSLMRSWLKIKIDCPYNLFESVKKQIDAVGGIINEADYGAFVRISAQLPGGAGGSFSKKLSDISSGTLAFTDLGFDFLPGPIA